MLSVYDDAHRAPIEYSDSDESSSDTPPVPLTPGPLDPEQCTVAGRGFSGGAAGSPLSLTVFSKDSRGIRITEGGACVSVNLIKPDTGEEVVKVEALDNKDGTYTATYTAPPRGDYKLCIAMNGIPVGGSPFPVFFSPPTLAEIAACLLAAKRMGSSPEAALKMVPDGADPLGDGIEKCLCVSNINQHIKPEQIKQLFQYCGKVVNVTFISEGRDTALVEFETALEAGCAIGLNGVMVGERPLTVKLAKSFLMGSDQPPDVESIATAQYTALSNATQNAHHLVMQLASLRAIARTALLPAIQAEERKYEGRAAALNAAAEISKKLGYEQPTNFYVPEPLPANSSVEGKPVFDKQKLGGPRHYNGRGRFVRQRYRSRSRSPLPFHRRSRRRSRSQTRKHRSRSRSCEHHRSHRHPSRSRSREHSSRRKHKEKRTDEKKRERRHSKRDVNVDEDTK